MKSSKKARSSQPRVARAQRAARLVIPMTTAFAAGLALGGLRAEATPETHNPYQVITQLGRVLVQIENDYVDPVDRRKLVEGAIKGMVENLDPHSSYMPPEEWAQFQSDTEGQFGGVGIEVDGRGERLVVIAPIEGSPAERAGIRSGDRIVAIDGVDATIEPLDKLVKRMRGAPGTKLKLTVHRESGRGSAVAGKPDSGIVPADPSTLDDAGAAPSAGDVAPPPERSGQTLTFELTREIIRVPSVAWKRMEGGVGYLRIKQFQERTYDELLVAAAKLREPSRGVALSGILLDVRSNPGGLVDQATDIADEFLSKGEIYSMRHRGRVVEALGASPGGAFVELPVVALVNEWSASASELLVGALQDNQRAKVVGVNTFGKGSVQSVFPLPNGSGLKLTTARYYTPSGHAIQADGIHPDVLLATLPSPSGLPVVRERDLPGHLSPEEQARASRGAPRDAAGAVVVDAGASALDGTPARDIPADPSSSKDAALRVGYELLRKEIAARGR